jgi:hypothetical protein
MDDREREMRAWVEANEGARGVAGWRWTNDLLSIIDAERALTRDLAAHLRSLHGMLAVHHMDMTYTDALLARCRDAGLGDGT